MAKRQYTSYFNPGSEDVGYDDHDMFDADAGVEVKKEVDIGVTENFSDEDEILAHRKNRKRKRKLVVEPSDAAVKLEAVDDVDDVDDDDVDVGAVADSPNVAAEEYSCDHCDEVFGTRQGLAVHVKR